jgi:protein ImuA
MGSFGNLAVVEALRARVAVIEGARGGAVSVASLGVPAIDAVLPGGGLRRGAVHEIAGIAASGFAAMAAGRMDGPVLWCVDQYARGHLYGPGLVSFGLAPNRLVVACCANRTDMLWAMEEGLRTPGLAAVVGEPGGTVDLTASRRLQLAAETGGALGLVLVRGPVRQQGEARKGDEVGQRDSAPRGGFAPSALASRWRVDSAPSQRPSIPWTEESGLPRWRVGLEHYRGALGGRSGGDLDDGLGGSPVNRTTSGDWMVTWRGESGHEQACRFSMVDAAFDRPSASEPESQFELRAEPRAESQRAG